MGRPCLTARGASTRRICFQDAVHAKQPDALVYINGGDGTSESTAFDAAYDKAVLPDVYSFDFCECTNALRTV